MKARPNKTRNQTRAVVLCLDELANHRSTLQTLASLLEACGESCEGPSSETVGETGTLMLEALDKMHACTQRLEGLLGK